MEFPVQVTFRDIDPSPSIETRIRERAAKLEQFQGRITGCRVVVEAPHRHQHKGTLYNVRVDVTVPGGELLVNQDSNINHAHEDVYVAIRDAFNAMERRLKSHSQRQRGEIKAHETPTHGTVLRMFPDYGFIEGSDGTEIYFHMNSVVEASFKDLDVGSQVRFVVAEGESEHGPQATTVRPIGKHHLD